VKRRYKKVALAWRHYLAIDGAGFRNGLAAQLTKRPLGSSAIPCAGEEAETALF
jgi:hypothetical protein